MNDANQSDSFSSVAKPVFRKWERLRILFNAIFVVTIILPSIVTLGTSGVGQIVAAVWWSLITLVTTNLFFFVWPALEAYMRWQGLKWSGITIVLFVVGTIFTFALAVGRVSGLTFNCWL